MSDFAYFLAGTGFGGLMTFFVCCLWIARGDD